jgi:hypothetical protein
MEIKRSGSRPSGKGPADWFTGTVRIDSLFEAPEPARVRGASVTFEPGARTAWHTHPLGQTLIVTSGLGWVQRRGGPIGRLSRLLHGPVLRTSRANFLFRRRHPRPLARATSTKSLTKHRREASGARSP